MKYISTILQVAGSLLIVLGVASFSLILDNPSSCLVQAQWNWADSANSGKWGNQSD